MKRNGRPPVSDAQLVVLKTAFDHGVRPSAAAKAAGVSRNTVTKYYQQFWQSRNAIHELLPHSAIVRLSDSAFARVRAEAKRRGISVGDMASSVVAEAAKRGLLSLVPFCRMSEAKRRHLLMAVRPSDPEEKIKFALSNLLPEYARGDERVLSAAVKAVKGGKLAIEDIRANVSLLQPFVSGRA